MPKTKKKFIDRKKAVTFNLVHRSQRDPLIADETAPQHVLVPVNANIPPKKEKEPELTPEQRKEEQRKYGVYFDDDYNYLQHLKDTREVTMVMQPKPIEKKKESMPSTSQIEPEKVITENLRLPSSVFASEIEEDVGLLNRSATQGLCLDLDPEVVAALDDDFNFEDPDNELEDNFIELAMGGDDDDDEEQLDDEDADDHCMSEDGDNESDKAFASDLDSDDDSGSQDHSHRPKMPKWDPQDKDDTKSRFSQYSMTSSVMQRNQGLSLLDNRFEKMFAEYDDTEVGALDLEDIEGFMPESHDMLLRAAEEFEESRRRYQLDKEAEIARIQRLEEIQEETSEDEMVTIEVEPKEKWDCETILSTYSNLYNHPKVIEEPKRSKRIQLNAQGIPKDILGRDNKLTVKSLAKFNAQNESLDDSDDEAKTHAESILSSLSVLSIRPKDETPEEKKERKRLLREYRRERRLEKKANKEAFKEEKKRQEKIMLNNRNNVQGNRIL
ncbi:protein LTV1 homolog [Hyposmocoma kahamanoa]|uniref:protein LTV1 homolog n=1 Tax=Hyposmocoma kahamanoa TaxID=1477025 RepID=UPI000E6D9D81|nr:protein LTV1 homolog [Hyposmocoma kahamanoa]